MDQLTKLLYCSCALALTGCGDDAGYSPDVPAGSRSVVQGGRQDIGEFRSIVASGKVPELSVLEETGFFAEHQIDLPAADCGASICAHPMLAVAPRFDGGNWTMAFVGMNTSVDPSTLPAKPRHLVLMLGRDTGTLSQILDGIKKALTPEDRVSLISARGLETPAQGIPPDQLLDTLVGSTLAKPAVSLYSALSGALELVKGPDFANYTTRVLLFPASFPESSLDQAQYVDLALEFAHHDTPISVFRELSRSSTTTTTTPAKATPVIEAALADNTSGNYYSADKGTDLTQAVSAEAQTGFVPLARNLSLTLTAAPGYRIAGVYGAPQARVEGERAVLTSPVSYVGARGASVDMQSGRRGGGGGWFVQLLADGPATGIAYSPADAFRLDFGYDDPVSGARVSATEQLRTPLGVGQNPPPTQPYFSDAARGKPFMMLNMYFALFTATRFANQNECGAARAIEPMMRDAWQTFSQIFPDADINADFDLLTALTANIQRTCREPVPKVIDVPFSCGYL
jgi:Ca-activated chloride channel family protein